MSCPTSAQPFRMSQHVCLSMRLLPRQALCMRLHTELPPRRSACSQALCTRIQSDLGACSAPTGAGASSERTHRPLLTRVRHGEAPLVATRVANVHGTAQPVVHHEHVPAHGPLLALHTTAASAHTCDGGPALNGCAERYARLFWDAPPDAAARALLALRRRRPASRAPPPPHPPYRFTQRHECEQHCQVACRSKFVVRVVTNRITSAALQCRDLKETAACAAGETEPRRALPPAPRGGGTVLAPPRPGLLRSLRSHVRARAAFVARSWLAPSAGGLHSQGPARS